MIQQHTDAEGGEVTPEEIWSVFRAEYLDRETPARARLGPHLSAAGEKDQLTVEVYVDGERHELSGEGNGPIAAFVDAIRGRAATTSGCSTTRARAVARAATRSRRRTSSARSGEKVLWGVGLDANIVTASLKAVVAPSTGPDVHSMP